MCGVKKEIGGQTGPMMLMMLRHTMTGPHRFLMEWTREAPQGPRATCVGPAGPACRALKMRYKPQQNAQNTRCGQRLWLEIPVKYNCGLEHGQPAQRTMSKVIFDGFPWVVDLFCSHSSQNGVPILQLMFLYEARARGPLSVKLERRGSSKP